MRTGCNLRTASLIVSLAVLLSLATPVFAQGEKGMAPIAPAVLAEVDVVGVARTGKEAIQISQELNPDVVLMDINMPDMDGITATEAIRGKQPAVQVVILSVQSDHNYMRRAMLAGARDFLTKRPMGDELISAIRRAGSMAQSERAKSAYVQPLPDMGNIMGGRFGVGAPKGKIITVYSPNGGVGCTTIAVNLAITLNNDDTRTVIRGWQPADAGGHDRRCGLHQLPVRAGRVEVLFEARGLTKTYHMGEVEVRALQGVDLDLRAGEFVVILGPSGSGKSTLLNILGGLDSPSGGAVSFRNHDLVNADDAGLTRYRREHVGFVFQFYNLIPSLTALENVALVTDIAESPMDPAGALALVGLGDRLHHFPSQLSGGEQQRVAIARAIAKRPDVLLCDEPTGALDGRRHRA